MSNTFVPRLGMHTTDAYLHGLTHIDEMFASGRIDYVSVDYFILRTSRGVYLIKETSYCNIEPGDLY
jgi:hypothetical protein